MTGKAGFRIHLTYGFRQLVGQFLIHLPAGECTAGAVAHNQELVSGYFNQGGVVCVRRFRLENPDRTVAGIQRHFTTENHVRKGYNDRLVTRVFTLDRFMHGEKESRAFLGQAVTDIPQVLCCPFVGQGEPVNRRCDPSASESAR